MNITAEYKNWKQLAPSAQKSPESSETGLGQMWTFSTKIPFFTSNYPFNVQENCPLQGNANIPRISPCNLWKTPYSTSIRWNWQKSDSAPCNLCAEEQVCIWTQTWFSIQTLMSTQNELPPFLWIIAAFCRGTNSLSLLDHQSVKCYLWKLWYAWRQHNSTHVYQCHKKQERRGACKDNDHALWSSLSPADNCCFVLATCAVIYLYRNWDSFPLGMTFFFSFLFLPGSLPNATGTLVLFSTWECSYPRWAPSHVAYLLNRGQTNSLI